MSCQGFLDNWLRRPPGWPILEALVITAAVLLAVTLADDAITAAKFDESTAFPLAAGPIPRNASLTFIARRGARGKRVRFTGADADSLALPALVDTP